MTLLPLLPLLPRVEYLDFQNLAEHREYRFRGFGPGGWTEFRLRIATAAFDAGRIQRQDGPDVSYRKLLQAVLAGETLGPGAITLDDADLSHYREAHAHAPKRRSWSEATSPTPARVPRKQPPAPSPQLAVPLAASASAPVLEQGQRVSHALFGAGVTTSSGKGRTVVQFDDVGPKTFVTSLLELLVLSAPHTWETGARGTNRPCVDPASEGANSSPSLESS
jgi:hypothetical protein